MVSGKKPVIKICSLLDQLRPPSAAETLLKDDAFQTPITIHARYNFLVLSFGFSDPFKISSQRRPRPIKSATLSRSRPLASDGLRILPEIIVGTLIPPASFSISFRRYAGRDIFFIISPKKMELKVPSVADK